MKQKHSIEEQSGFWVKLLGILAAVIIIAVVVFGGIQFVTSQIAGLQRQLDTKTIEFDVVSGQLAEANRELGARSSELELTKVELDKRTKDLEQAQSDSANKSVELENTRSLLEANVVQLSDTENELSSTESILAAKVSELVKRTSDLVALSSKLADTASRLEEQDRELSAKADALAATESELSTVKNELEATAKLLEQSQNQVEKKDDELSIVSEELNFAKLDLSTTRGALNSKALELTQAQDEISEKAAKLVAWRSKYYMKSGELTQAQDEISENAVALAALRSKFLKKSSELRTSHIKLANTARALEEMRAVIGAESQRTMGELIALLPDSFLVGEENWTRDVSRGQDGVENVPGIPDSAAGKQIYYRTQEGGRMSLSFAVFATQDDAAANYRRILGIRSSLIGNGFTVEDFPQPNRFASGLYGSFSIFQIDAYFIEVYVELHLRGNPLVPLSRETLRFFESNRGGFEASSSALGITQQELEAHTRELETATGQLAKTKTELEVAYIMSAESQTELVAYLAAVELFNCYLHEIVGLVNHVLDDERSFSTEQRNLYRRHVDFLLDGSENANPIQDFCSNFSTDWAALLSEEAGKRASNRVQSELDLSSVDVTRMGNSFFEKGLGTPEGIGERTAELAVDVYAKADELLLRMLGSNAFDLLAEALAGYRATQ